jgi:hypothetical protein
MNPVCFSHMEKEKKARSYICSSADWDCFVEAAFSPQEAASIALQKQVQSYHDGFSVGATIAVIPVSLNKKDCEYIYSPSILANIGMYSFADDLSRNLRKDSNGEEGGLANDEQK